MEYRPADTVVFRILQGSEAERWDTKYLHLPVNGIWPTPCSSSLTAKSATKRNQMHFSKTCSISLTLAAILMLAGCSTTESKAADVTPSIRKSLDTANFKDVSIAQDRVKGVITLGGQVATDADKAQAEDRAKSLAGTQVVANQIAVIPAGSETLAKKINANLDEGIGNNLDAALLQSNLQNGVKHSEKNGVVTLSGEVRSQSDRIRTQAVAAVVPNVLQVVNELQVKNQKATSSK